MYKEQITLIDFSTFLYGALFIANKEAKNEDREVNKEDIFNALFSILNSVLTTYSNCYIIFDGTYCNEYRRKIFSEYKRNRAKRHLDESVKLMHSCKEEIKELLSFYPVKIIEINVAEADDVIYCLSERYYKENNILILTTDKDLVQIMNFFPNIEIYNLFRKRYYEKDPLIIEKKVIIGDISDNIPGISRVGKKIFEKMMDNQEIYEEKIKGNESIIEKFRKIIDLRLLPEQIKEKILTQDDNNDFFQYQPEEIEYYFYHHRYKKLLDRWEYYSSNIK